jgi:hypothetical protein
MKSMPSIQRVQQARLLVNQQERVGFDATV